MLYLEYMLCISTSFWVLHAPKSWLKPFFDVFQPFLFISNFFSDFAPEINKKLLKMNKKTYFAYSSKLVNMQNWLTPWGGTPKLSFLVDFYWNEQKRLKTDEKRFRPAFGCAQHPKAGRNTQQIQLKLSQELGNL